MRLLRKSTKRKNKKGKGIVSVIWVDNSFLKNKNTQHKIDSIYEIKSILPLTVNNWV